MADSSPQLQVEQQQVDDNAPDDEQQTRDAQANGQENQQNRDTQFDAQDAKDAQSDNAGENRDSQFDGISFVESTIFTALF